MSHKDIKLNRRQIDLLHLFSNGAQYAISDFEVYASSRATLKRDLLQLQNIGYIESTGELKSVTYSLAHLGLLHRPFDTHQYFTMSEQDRAPMVNYNFDIFKILSTVPVLDYSEKMLLDEATKKFKQNAEKLSDTVYKKEMERFVIELSWKSSKIEGNTYTLLDTEKLIKDGIEAVGHTKEEAIMILNHKKAFAYILESKKDSTKIISRRGLEDIHQLLVDKLGVGTGLRKTAVGITGSAYKPVAAASQIEEQIAAFIACIQKEKNVYAKALIALIGESYIQPFEDGNKRTARLFANALLLLEGCAPLSYRNVDEMEYKEAMLIFYEQNSIKAFKKIFIEQYVFSAENYNISRE